MIGEKEYTAELPNGDLNSFLSDMNESKTSYSESEEEGLNDLFDKSNTTNGNTTNGATENNQTLGGANGTNGTTDNGNGEEKTTFNPELANLSSEFAAMLTDLAIPSLIAMLLKCDSEKLQATEEQYKQLVEAYSKYLQTKQIAISPGLMLVGAIVSIYATKIPTAIKERELKQREQELNRREEELEKRARLLYEQAQNKKREQEEKQEEKVDSETEKTPQ